MFFIIRAAFWIGIIVLFLPIGGDTQFKTSDALDAARTAVVDLSGFCDRNPSTCETSAYAVSAFGHKMAEGAKWAYAMVRDEDYTPADRQTQTRTVRSIPFSGQNFAAGQQRTMEIDVTPDTNKTRIVPTDEPNTTVLQRGTLTPADIQTPWEGGQRI